MSASPAVVGAADHYGRAELVTLALRDGEVVLLDRRQAVLIDEGLPVAPYHHEAPELELAAAVELVNRVRRSVMARCRAALATLREACRPQALILPASPYERLPAALEAVLRSRPLTNAADGMLYRESLAEAAAELDLEVRRYPRRADPTALAASALGVERSEVTARLDRLGRAAGPPWRKDHREAAAAALLVLAPHLGS